MARRTRRPVAERQSRTVEDLDERTPAVRYVAALDALRLRFVECCLPIGVNTTRQLASGSHSVAAAEIAQGEIDAGGAKVYDLITRDANRGDGA